MTAIESNKSEWVVLVDAKDQEIGLCEKLQAHQENRLHRAFSVFIFQRDEQNEIKLLLQQRGLTKYHSPGLWTNTCCSHPRQNEDIVKAGQRRLAEELGITVSLKDVGWFHYNAHFSNGLAENEIDHVLLGCATPSLVITPHPAEVHAYRWISLSQLQHELTTHPEQFTPWLPMALAMAVRHLMEVFPV